MRKPVDIIFFLLILGLLLVSIIIANRPSPASEVDRLQEQVKQLQARVVEVEKIQGWQTYYLDGVTRP